LGGMQETKRKVGRAILVAPEKLGKDCAFKKVCCRKCVASPNRPLVTEYTTEMLKREMDFELRRFGQPPSPPMTATERERKRQIAENLIFMLQGTAIPNTDGMHYAYCGEGRDGEGVQAMRMLTLEEMGKILKWTKFGVNALGGFQAVSPCAPPAGMIPQFARLLAQISAVELPRKRAALETLIMDGGAEGIRMVSWMASEPTVGKGARGEYLRALKSVVSCASFSSETGRVEISEEDCELASALSRFFPVGNAVECIGGGRAVDAYLRDEIQKIPEEPLLPRLRQMVVLGIGEFLQALLDISARIDSILSSSREQVELYRGLALEYYRSLRLGVELLAGKGAANVEMLEEVCKRREAEFSPPEEMDAGEQAMLKQAVRGLGAEGKLDPRASEAIGGLLTAQMDASVYTKMLNSGDASGLEAH
jgi:hypothetical protein